MADSNIRISKEAMLTLGKEQVKRQEETGNRPALKDLVEEAVNSKFGGETDGN